MAQINLYSMSLFLIGIILIGISLAPCSSAAEEEMGRKSIKLTVFYETLCPDSKRFFTRVLAPSIRKIENFTKVQLVPYGHAQILGVNQMKCQHGPRECDGNRLDACIQHYARSKRMSDVVAATACIFEKRNQAKECTKKHLPSLNWDEIQTCRTGDESFQMMVKFDRLQGRVKYIPKIVLDDSFNQEIQDECESGILECLCNHIKGTKPAECD